LIYESNTQEISAKGTCYGINLFNNWLFGRCEPFWFENLNSGGHSWALHVESADAFVLEAIPVCFYPVYEDFSKTVSQRSCTQDPCPAPQPQPPEFSTRFQLPGQAHAAPSCERTVPDTLHFFGGIPRISL